MKNKYVFVAVMLSLILAVSFGLTNIYVSQNQAAEDSDFVVVTSFYPMYIAAMNVIGDTDGVTLKNLSEPQTGCLHDFQLTPADMKLLSTADVFVINGGGIEAFMEDIAKQYPELVIVEAREGIELLANEHDHEHEVLHTEDNQEEIYETGEAHEHDHGEVNAHAWMSVGLYRTQISNIAQGLAEADEEHAASYLANQKEYDGKLSELQEMQEEIIHFSQGESVVLLHCAYDYIALDYGMAVPFCMDLDEERQVSAGEVAEVLEIIKQDNVKYIFAEELYAASMCEMIQKEAKVEVIYLNPLTRGEYDPDSYIEGMRKNMELILDAFSK